MSTTMRPTLQTVPESLPADHVTSSAAPATTTAAAPTQPRHPRPIFKAKSNKPFITEEGEHPSTALNKRYPDHIDIILSRQANGWFVQNPRSRETLTIYKLKSAYVTPAGRLVMFMCILCKFTLKLTQ
ncbi:unnamed protein product [Leptosia nina]|uniref:Uncharacterized protein n=1 Tax=Leptosia nina TaxID=320188 RepID=A0AAV1JMD2_9NEOP